MKKRLFSVVMIIMTVIITACSSKEKLDDEFGGILDWAAMEAEAASEVTAPVVTQELSVTQAPAVTKAPTVTKISSVTKTSSVTKKTAATKSQAATKTPFATEAPKVTVAVTAAPTVTEAPIVTVASKKNKINRIEEIMNITDVRATPEYDIFSCYIDVNDKTNPYDVNWDYGKDYDKLVNSCDFDKIFDADFYSETYPYLALMYHGNTELLKKHFMTVGIHEGRTGKKGFSYAEIISILKKYFTSKSDAKLIKSLPAENATDGNFSAAYVIYLDHITKITKKNIKADTKYADMDFHKNILTKVQKTELDEINAYRKEVGAVELTWNHTMAESANYRAYESVVHNLKAHTWGKTHHTEAIDFMHYINGSYYDENTLTITHRYTKDVTTRDLTGWAKSYYNSPSHKEAMLEKDSIKYGGSNLYGDGDTLRQFDLFANTKR